MVPQSPLLLEFRTDINPLNWIKLKSVFSLELHYMTNSLTYIIYQTWIYKKKL